MYHDFFGYKENQPVSTWGYKEIAELHKFYKADVILETIEKCTENINYAMTHVEFNNDFAMMRYVFAIIKGNIRKVAKDVEKRNAKLNILQSKDGSIEIVEEESFNNSIHVHTANDLSKFIGDDE